MFIQKLTSSVLQELPTLLFEIISFTRTHEFLIRLFPLARQLLDLADCFPSAEITSVHHFCGCRRPKSGPQICIANT